MPPPIRAYEGAGYALYTTITMRGDTSEIDPPLEEGRNLRKFQESPASAGAFPENSSRGSNFSDPPLKGRVNLSGFAASRHCHTPTAPSPPGYTHHQQQDKTAHQRPHDHEGAQQRRAVDTPHAAVPSGPRAAGSEAPRAKARPASAEAARHAWTAQAPLVRHNGRRQLRLGRARRRPAPSGAASAACGSRCGRPAPAPPPRPGRSGPASARPQDAKQARSDGCVSRLSMSRAAIMVLPEGRVCARARSNLESPACRGDMSAVHQLQN